MPANVSSVSTISTASTQPSTLPVTASTVVLRREVTVADTPAGVQFAGVHAGVKKRRLDLGLITCPDGTSVAACTTQNPVHAACIDRTRSLLKTGGGTARAVVVNSGNANALTGPEGVAHDAAMAEAVAAALGVDAGQVFTSSTGVIGVPLPIASITGAAPALAEALSSAPGTFAEAILTTDTGTKTVATTVELVDAEGTPVPVKLLGVAKGSGMVHPNMATTLGFVTTDAKVSPLTLQRLLSQACERSFNAICVDGDTSTNDALFALATGASGCLVETPESMEVFTAALQSVLIDLARQVAADGEGATRLLQVDVHGAADEAAARHLARAVCRGSLFKSSVFAGDPAWGRLAAAVGQAALELEAAGSGDDRGDDWTPDDNEAHPDVHPAGGFDVSQLHISAQGIPLLVGGQPVAASRGQVLRALHAPEVRWTVTVGDGPGAASAFGCDLTYDYVRINADESSQLEVTREGSVGRKVTLGAYTPRLKHELLVDGLAYVRRFAGLRVAVSFKGSVLSSPTLLDAAVRDLELMADAGLRPLAVVPGEEDASHLVTELAQAGARVRRLDPVLGPIAAWLDRGGIAVVPMAPDPGELVARCIKLGVQKLLVLADDQGLRDDEGLVSLLTLEQARVGLHARRFDAHDADFLAFAGHAATQGLQNLHLLDGRLPHALVAELFTDAGVGTLLTRQLAGAPTS